jgi:predicted HicB family RNase H-like nuclease
MHTTAMTDETTATRQPTERQRKPLRTRTAATWTKTAQRYLPDEHAILVKAATAANISINDYVREAVLAAAADDGFELEEK